MSSNDEIREFENESDESMSEEAQTTPNLLWGGEGGSPSWSLITVAYNSADALREFWTGVGLAERPDVEWIVVDNASHDGSADLARSLGARVIEAGENRGFAAANNLGFVQSIGHYVMFINPDVRVNLDNLPHFARHLDVHAADLVSAQLMNSDGTLQPNGRGAPTLIRKVRHRIHPETLNGTYRLFAGVGEELEVDWLTGACVAGRREHLAQLGPWDDHFFVYHEDADLAVRNARAGGRSVVLGDFTWEHGWAREAAGANINAWKLELSSMRKFYTRYPRLLFSASRTA